MTFEPVPTKADTKTREQWAALADRLAVWSLMTKQERRVAGEPVTLQEFANHYSCSIRWIEKTRAKPEYKQKLEDLRSKQTVRALLTVPDAVPLGPKRLDADLSNAQIFGEVVRSQLVAAAAGDKTALDFIKTANISKPFIDQLSAEFQTEFPDASDEELAEMFVDAFPELCAGALELRGWKVVAPE